MRSTNKTAKTPALSAIIFATVLLGSIVRPSHAVADAADPFPAEPPPGGPCKFLKPGDRCDKWYQKPSHCVESTDFKPLDYKLPRPKKGSTEDDCEVAEVRKDQKVIRCLVCTVDPEPQK